MLINYPWPGNVRELKNIAEQISVLAQDKILRKRIEEISYRNVNATGYRYWHMQLQRHDHDFANEREILTSFSST